MGVNGSQFAVHRWFGRSLLFILLLPKIPVTTEESQNREL